MELSPDGERCGDFGSAARPPSLDVERGRQMSLTARPPSVDVERGRQMSPAARPPSVDVERGRQMSPAAREPSSHVERGRQMSPDVEMLDDAGALKVQSGRLGLKRKSLADAACQEIAIGIPLNDPVAAKVARVAAFNAAKVAARRRREVKGKAVCIEDSKARRKAMEAASIASFFTSSRNPRSSKPLRIGSPSRSSECASITMSLNTVSLDTELLGSEPPGNSHKDNNGVSMQPAETSDVAEEILQQLRQDMVHISDGEDELESDDNLREIPPPKKPKVNYDRTRRFQNEWAAKLVWAEPIRGTDGRIHLVKCTVCSTFEQKSKILGPKWDTLTKHEGRRKAVFDMPKYQVKKGEWYVSTTCKHQVNLRLFAGRQPLSVLQQVNNNPSVTLQKKIVQFCTIFQILSGGRPMLEYEQRESLYAFLAVPNLPRMHWSDSSAWKMADSMYNQVKEVIRKKISTAHFVAITCDEVTTIDNGSWICIHAYIVENFVRTPHLISLQRLVDGSGADILTVVIMKALQCGGDLSSEQISRKLVCFGADGVNTFQGTKSGVTLQIRMKWAPFCMGVHCMAHRCNLAAKSLSTLPIFTVVEQVIQKTHSYFSKSPKRFSEYQKLAEAMETKGLKPLLQVTTRWVSLLEPLRRLLADYRTLLAKMKVDSSKIDASKMCMTLMIDPYTLLGMTALMPLLEALDILVTFAQQRDVYVCDFVAALKIAEGQLYTLFVDKATSYATDEFWAMKNIIECSHSQIHMQWMSDMNDHSAQLVFVANGEKIWAMHQAALVDREVFAAIIMTIKMECSGAARQLLKELETRFPSNNVMDALGILYPQYWLQPKAEETFYKHLSILMDYYCEPKFVEVDKVNRLIPPILDRHSLETQQGLFKLAMVNNAKKHMEPPFELNPLTRLWRSLDSCTVLRVKAFPEYFRLAEVAIVQVLGSVEDERCFSSLAFLKNKLRNSLDTHLECVVGMYSQRVFTLETFPYDAAHNDWAAAADRQYGL